MADDIDKLIDAVQEGLKEGFMKPLETMVQQINRENDLKIKAAEARHEMTNTKLDMIIRLLGETK